MTPWLSACLCLRWFKRPAYRTHSEKVEKRRGLRKASTNAQSMVECEPGQIRGNRHTPISAKTPATPANRPLKEYVFPRKKQASISPVVTPNA